MIGQSTGAWRARRVAQAMEPDERDLTLGWIDALLQIRASRRAAGAKAQAVLAATFDRDLMLVLGKALALELRRSAWDDQSVAVRAALVVAAVVALSLAGGLIGLAIVAAVVAGPLWLVFGPGFAALVALRDELLRLQPQRDDRGIASPL